MEISCLNNCQIRRVCSSIKSPNTVKLFSSFGSCDINIVSAQSWQRKIKKKRTVSRHLHLGFRSSFFIAEYPGRLNERGPYSAHVVKATSSSPDKGGEGSPDQSKTRPLSVNFMFGIIGRLTKVILDFLFKKKEILEKIEEKVEDAVDVVEEVADTVREVAEFTEEIAEKVEGAFPKDGMVHKTADVVDNISETVSKNAQILEEKAERIKKTIKAVDDDVDAVEDAVQDFADTISKAIKDDHDNPINVGENSSGPTVEATNNQSMDSFHGIPTERFEVIKKDIIHPLLWFPFPGGERPSTEMKVIIILLGVIVLGACAVPISYFASWYFLSMLSPRSLYFLSML